MPGMFPGHWPGMFPGLPGMSPGQFPGQLSGGLAFRKFSESSLWHVSVEHFVKSECQCVLRPACMMPGIVWHCLSRLPSHAAPSPDRYTTLTPSRIGLGPASEQTPCSINFVSIECSMLLTVHNRCRMLPQVEPTAQQLHCNLMMMMAIYSKMLGP